MKKPSLIRSRALPAALLLLANALGAAAALAMSATPAKPPDLPPLGLYRIDSDAAIAAANAPVETRLRTDGASGDVTGHWKAGPHTATRQFLGEGPVTHCVKSVTGGMLPMPHHAGACTANGVTGFKDGFTQTANCAFGKFDLTVRQLDKDRWEFLYDVTMTSTGAAPSMIAIAPLLKQQAAHGATPEARARARQQLAELPLMQKQADATYETTIARMNEELRTTTDPQEKAALRMTLERLRPGTSTMKSRSRTVWTRIANTCHGAK